MPAQREAIEDTPSTAAAFASARRLFAELGHGRDLEAPVTAVLCWSGRPAFAAGDGCLHTLSAASGAAGRVEAHSGAILAAASSPGGEAVLTGGDDGFARLVAPAGAIREVAMARRGWIDHVAWAAWGGIAVAAGRDVEIVVEGVVQQIELPSVCGGLSFAPKGRRLAMAHYGGVTLASPGVKAWTTDSLEWKGSHIGVTWSRDCRFVLSVMQESALHGWRLADKTALHMGGFPAKPRSMSWSRDGRWLATSGGQGVLLWSFKGKDGPMGQTARQLAARESVVTAVAFHPKGRLISIGYRDGCIVVLNWGSQSTIVLRAPDGQPIREILWGPDGVWLAFAAGEGLAGQINTAGWLHDRL